MKHDIRIKRVYEPPENEDGCRILVDRMWPRGMSKEKAGIDHWFKQLAPSNELRKWYGHDPQKWEQFQEKYFSELAARPEALAQLMRLLCRQRTTTFVYSSKEREFNNAAALKTYIETHLDCDPPPASGTR